MAKHIGKCVPTVIIFSLLAFLILFSVTGAPAYAATWQGGSGSGSSNDPYVIGDAASWNSFAEWYNSSGDGSGLNVSLAGNITFSNDFTQIGTGANPFTGSFNGNNYVLININHTASDIYTGAFGVIGQNGSVRSLGVYEGMIKGESYVGGIAGRNEGNISSCFSTAEVISSGRYGGGIVGINTGSINTSYSGGNITVTGANSYAGGLVGYHDGGSIAYSHSLGKISGATYGGGVVGGRRETAEISYCYYNKDAFTGNRAIGNETPGIIDGVSNKVLGYSENEFDTRTLAEMNYSNAAAGGAWVKTFRSEDASACFAPALSGFTSPGTAYNYSYNSVILRKYGIADASSTSEWGTVQNPFLISEPVHLLNLAQGVNDKRISYSGKYFKMTDDLDFSGVENFTPIGIRGSTIAFSGNFDGGNRVISNLTLNYPGVDYVAVFGELNNASISNLTFDETCIVNGANYAATVSGYATNSRFNNIESRAQITGNGNIGGIIGFSANSSSLTNILSAVNISFYVGGNAANGLIGYGTPSLVNAWYFVPYGATVRTQSQNSDGNLMIEDANGKIIAEKATDGVIKFSLDYIEPSASDMNLEYRNASERTEATGNEYVAAMDSRRNIIFARFVREIDISGDAECDASLKSVNATDGSPQGTKYYTQKYYKEQEISLIITVNTEYYLSKIYVVDKSGTKTDAAVYGYMYEQQNSDAYKIYITLNLKMTNDIYGIYVETEDMDTDGIPSRVYDGEPTDYRHKNEGGEYMYEYGYSIGRAPVDKGSYELTVSIKKGAEMRGKSIVTFVIEQRPIVITEDALQRVKEFDGDNNEPKIAAVDMDIIAAAQNIYGDNIVDRDKLSGGGYRITVSAKVIYATLGSDIGNCILEFTLSLGGESGSNYVLVTPVMTNVTGEIVKKLLQFKVDVLERVYDGEPAAITAYGTVTGKESVSGYPVGETIRFLKQTDGGYAEDAAINAGVYLLEINAADTEHYIVEFKEVYEFTVKPMPVSIVFGNLNPVYNGGIQTVTASYYSSVEKKTYHIISQDIAYMNELDGDFVSEFRNAGNYTVKVFVYGNYTPSGSTGITQAVMQKAPQQTLVFDGLDGAYAYGDAAVQLSTLGGSGGGAVTFCVVSGFGEITGALEDMLLFTGGGEIKIKAVKAESDNYLEAECEKTVTAAKLQVVLKLLGFSVDYGDKIEFEFFFEGLLARDEDAGPSGFKAPSVLLNNIPFSPTGFYDVDVYEITLIENAESDGYTFDYSYFGSTDIYMTVNQKAITVYADDKSSVYGDADEPLTFTVYDADGILDEYILTITLSRVAGNDAGFYDIEAQSTLDADNPNYSIVFEKGVYEIERKILSVRMVGDNTDGQQTYMRKLFGADDPTLSETNFVITGIVLGDTLDEILHGGDGSKYYLNILRADGQNAYSAVNPNLTYGYYLYYAAPDMFVDDNYILDFSAVNLRIYPNTPTFTISSESVKIQYGSALSSLNPANYASTSATGSFAWESPATQPDFSAADVLSFKVLFTSGDRNYLDTEIFLDLSVIPREITVEFTGAKTFVYSGQDLKSMTYIFKNVIGGDDMHETVVYYSGGVMTTEVKNAGTYTVRVFINNGNYVLTGSNETEITVTKKELTVYLDDILLPQDVVPEKNFKYEGFVSGEDASVLTKQPDVTFRTEVGNHKVTPFGAEAANYEIKYLESKQSVAKTKLENGEYNFLATGSFDYLLEMELKQIKKAENRSDYNVVNDAFNQIKGTDDKFSSMKLSYVMLTRYQIDGKESPLVGTGRASIKLPTSLNEAKKLSVILVKDGEAFEAKNIERIGNVVYFDLEDADYFAIVAPPDYTWLIVMVVIFILIVLVFALDIVSERLGIGRHKNKKSKR